MDIFTLDFWKGLFADLVQFLTELPLKFLDLILDAVLALINAIPAPSFIEGKNIGSFFDGIPYVPYFLDRSGFAECIAIVGAGVAFLLARKALTLFQW